MPSKQPFSDAEKARRRAYLKRWRHSPQGKAWLRAYARSSAKDKATKKRHRETAKWKAALKRYWQSPKGKAKTKERNRKRMARNRAFVLAQKQGKPCHDCQRVLEPRKMHFHHTEKNKRFSVSQGSLRTLRTLKTEIAKCLLLCTNCHSKRHLADRIAGRRAQAARARERRQQQEQ